MCSYVLVSLLLSESVEDFEMQERVNESISKDKLILTFMEIVFARSLHFTLLSRSSVCERKDTTVG